MEWLVVPGSLSGNEILRGDGFYISYMRPGALQHIPWAASEQGQAETALCVGDEFYILNGDFRKEYEAAFPGGLKSVLEVYEKNKDQCSPWSTKLARS